MKASGDLSPGIEHVGNDSMVPLPATMIHDLSALLASNATTMALYSPFPFPNRSNRVLDDFQQSAWTFLSQNPVGVFKRLEMVEGATVMRVAIADRLTAEGCVSCHITFAGTPKTDWELGDVRGVLEIGSDVSSAIALASDLTNRILISVLAAGLIISAILLVSVKAISTSINNLTQAMRKLPKGKLDTEVPAVERVDEVGKMAEAVLIFKENAKKVALMSG